MSLWAGMSGAVMAQGTGGPDTDSLGTHLSYELSAEAAVGSGDWNAYQTVSNRYHTLGLRSNTAVGRAALTLTHDFSKKYQMTAVADVLGTIHGDHKFYLQQLYVNFKLNHFFAEIGSREIEPILRNRRLSSGNIIESGNAKPIPQLRIGTDGFWTVPGLNKWLEVYFDGAYGKYIDGGYKQDVATTLQTTFTRGMWMHHKKLYLRSNSQKLFYGMIGIDHFVQFGVQRYDFVDGQMVLIKDSPATIKDFWRALIPKGDSGYATNGGGEDWVYGNHVGSYTIQIGCNITPRHQVNAFMDNIFEDGSGMAKRNGWDGLWGLSYQNTTEGVQYVRGATFEYLQTTNQSGVLHFDPGDWTGEMRNIPSEHYSTGNDDYYNNGFYQSYTTYGMGQGTPLLPSPRYRGELGYNSTNIKAWHVGVEGDLLQSPRYGSFSYLVKGSYRKSYGEHVYPFLVPEHTFSMLVEADWAKGPWRGSVSYGLDGGDIYGNNNTFDLKITYHGRIF